MESLGEDWVFTVSGRDEVCNYRCDSNLSLTYHLHNLHVRGRGISGFPGGDLGFSYIVIGKWLKPQCS